MGSSSICQVPREPKLYGVIIMKIINFGYTYKLIKETEVISDWLNWSIDLSSSSQMLLSITFIMFFVCFLLLDGARYKTARRQWLIAIVVVGSSRVVVIVVIGHNRSLPAEPVTMAYDSVYLLLLRGSHRRLHLQLDQERKVIGVYMGVWASCNLAIPQPIRVVWTQQT